MKRIDLLKVLGLILASLILPGFASMVCKTDGVQYGVDGWPNVPKCKWADGGTFDGGRT